MLPYVFVCGCLLPNSAADRVCVQMLFSRYYFFSFQAFELETYFSGADVLLTLSAWFKKLLCWHVLKG